MVPAETKEMLVLSFALLQACQGKWSRSISPAHLLSRGHAEDKLLCIHSHKNGGHQLDFKIQQSYSRYIQTQFITNPLQ